VLPARGAKKQNAVSTAIITSSFLISIILLLPPTVKLLVSIKKSYISDVGKF
jgi:hypothetical protein